MYSEITEADLKRHSEAKHSPGKFPGIPCEIHFSTNYQIFTKKTYARRGLGRAHIAINFLLEKNPKKSHQN